MDPMSPAGTGLNLVLAGAAIGNGNRGIEALARSVVDSVEHQAPGSTLSILDDGWGVRVPAGPNENGVTTEFVGVRRSRRWHRQESWAQIRVAQTLGLRNNPAARRFATADAVLDLSAGDSFTDLYGLARLAAISAPKEAALRAGRPLVLLPQTYGPFRATSGRRNAERIVRSAALAYARDPWSYERLLELAGPQADRTRLRLGVDVAFALEPRRPEDKVAARLEQLSGNLTAGVNVSGLLRDDAAQRRFGIKGDYLDTMTSVVRGLLKAGAHVVFVPHVHVGSGVGESDVAAIRQIQERLEQRDRDRTTMVPPDLGAAELKWCIAGLDWFVGSRMHSTIAALSTLTPAASYAYSDKTIGVFQTCGVGEEVVDARRAGGPEAAAEILASFERRDRIRDQLSRQAPDTIESSRRQLSDVLEAVAGWRDSAVRAGTIA